MFSGLLDILAMITEVRLSSIRVGGLTLAYIHYCWSTDGLSLSTSTILCDNHESHIAQYIATIDAVQRVA